MIGEFVKVPGFRGAELKNSRLLQTEEGASVRIEVCYRKCTPTEYERLRADYVEALIVAAEELYWILVGAHVEQTAPQTLIVKGVSDRELTRLGKHLRRIGDADEAFTQYVATGKEAVR